MLALLPDYKKHLALVLVLLCLLGVLGYALSSSHSLVREEALIQPTPPKTHSSNDEGFPKPKTESNNTTSTTISPKTHSNGDKGLPLSEKEVVPDSSLPEKPKNPTEISSSEAHEASLISNSSYLAYGFVLSSVMLGAIFILNLTLKDHRIREHVKFYFVILGMMNVCLFVLIKYGLHKKSSPSLHRKRAIGLSILLADLITVAFLFIIDLIVELSDISLFSV